MLQQGTDRPSGRPRICFRKTTVAAALLSCAAVFAVGVPLALAQTDLGADITSTAETMNQAVGLEATPLPALIGRIIGYFLGLLGVVALALIIYAGFLWMTASGDEGKVKKAKDILTNAFVGLLIIASAYTITMFIINALFGAGGMGGGIIGGGQSVGGLYSSSRGRGELGNGIIEYHYPEPGQVDVARNTKLAITFKRPLVLSSVIKNYDDKGTFDLADDTVGGQPVTDATVFELNTDNIRLVMQTGLGDMGSGTADAQFDTRVPAAAAVAASLRKTAVRVEFNPLDKQTITFRPTSYLGSPTSAVNYRVALRGGVNGVKVWDVPTAPNQPPQIRAALPQAYADGGYFWSFATGTELDTTPPKLTWVVPSAIPDPGVKPLDRNQLLQAYFDEALDPTTADGLTAAGFNNITVEAKCLGVDCTAPYDASGFQAVAGSYVVGNRNRTVEFVPSTRCDGVATNSCGDPVYCLPKNAEVRVMARAATVGDDAPAAALDNGLEDMAGNSFDGNRNGVAEGPQPPVQPGGRAGTYDLNAPPSDIAAVSDTATWRYEVGSNVDLVAPVLTGLNPPPVEADYPDGYNRIPSEIAPALTWSKPMSISSIRTGGFDEATGAYRDDNSTVVLRSRELEKISSGPCTDSCQTARLEPPGFFVESDLVSQDGEPVTVMRLRHPARPFYKANDLGFTSDDLIVFAEGYPIYVPIARARLSDLKQNCFWPSVYRPEAGTGECSLSAGQSSCCTVEPLADGQFVTSCTPR